MVIELKVNGNLVYASVDEQSADSAVYRRALVAAKTAIENHKANSPGATATLYETLEFINKALSIQNPGQNERGLPKDRDYPPFAAQCDECGGHGCATCGDKGWVPPNHPSARKCHREACGKPIEPSCVAVYCSNQCAFEDA